MNWGFNPPPDNSNPGPNAEDFGLEALIIIVPGIVAGNGIPVYPNKL